ncbi:MAG: YSC84-related protein [Planctomycetota bacterium]|jgi:lipid-binding SYLF domain-containing protein
MNARTPAGFLAAAVVLAAGCAGSQKAYSPSLSEQVTDTIAVMQSQDPNLKRWFDDGSYGYAVFPSVGKGAIGIGGAYGEGEVFEQGEPIGTATLSQATIGLQLGGQAYSEVVFFRDRMALEMFKASTLELSAQASAVAVKAGGSADADYQAGVAIFTMAKGGLMFEASVGGQKFAFTPTDGGMP